MTELFIMNLVFMAFFGIVANVVGAIVNLVEDRFGLCAINIYSAVQLLLLAYTLEKIIRK